MTIKKAKRQKVHSKFNGCCAYCGIIISYEEMTVDHIFPKSLLYFVKDDIDNLNPSCRSCNTTKGNRDMESFRKRLFGDYKRKFYFEKYGLPLQ